MVRAGAGKGLPGKWEVKLLRHVREMETLPGLGEQENPEEEHYVSAPVR